MNLPFSLCFSASMRAQKKFTFHTNPLAPNQWSRGGPSTGGFSMEFPVDFLRIPTPNGHSIRNQPADLASQGPLVQPVIKPASTHHENHETAKHFWNHDEP
jgi:hypothetical protein